MSAPESVPAWIPTLLADADAAEARGNPALAVALLQRAGAASPTAAVHRRLGLALVRAGRLPEAAGPLRSALVLTPQDPEVRYALGICLIALGRRREGAALAEARFDLPALGARKPAGFPFPEWRGEPLAGKRLAIFPELAIADQLLAARLVPVLQAQGADVLLFAPPALAALYGVSFPQATVLAASGAVEFDDPDAWTMIGSLLGLAAPEAPPPAAGLSVPAPTRRSGFRLALAVRGLEAGLAERLRAELPAAEELPDDGDLLASATTLAGADLIVCTDGPIAQLASGLGRPALVLAPARGVHWSFSMASQAALWRPQAEVFRADPKGGWDSAIERLLTEAQTRTQARTPSGCAAPDFR
jgi:tetratricopeptide (TPR) repeat protein